VSLLPLALSPSNFKSTKIVDCIYYCDHIRGKIMQASNDNIDPNAAIPLGVAAALAYPKGGMTARALRREASNGRLVIERTGKRLFTSLAAIGEMRKLCHVNDNRQDFGGAQQARTAHLSTSSSTVDDKLALAAARAMTKELRESSRNISQKVSTRQSV
jgi:hypothetical protein